MTDTVRVVISLYAGENECTYHRVAPNHDDPYAFDIDADEFTRWESIREEWETVLEELSTLYGARSRQIEFSRETARLRANAETAQAAYDAHLKRIAEA